MGHMPMASSMATPGQENGMGHQQAYLAAVAGKHHGDKAHRTNGTFALVKGLIFGAIALLVASFSGTTSYAQEGPFAGMAGVWSGGGSVTLDAVQLNAFAAEPLMRLAKVAAASIRPSPVPATATSST
jgi:hypothetical protein